MIDNRQEMFARFTRDRANLVPVLQNVQETEGYLSPEAIDEISRFLNITANDIYSVASFYAQFRFERQGKHTIKVCQGTACHVMGGKGILDYLSSQLGIQKGQTTADGMFSLERVACLGCCGMAPVVAIDKDFHGRVTVKRLGELLGEYRSRKAN